VRVGVSVSVVVESVVAEYIDDDEYGTAGML
jgi:hypothetical protein